jgi:hypothetical protein
VLQKLRGELAVTTAFRYLGRPVLINFPDWRTRRRKCSTAWRRSRTPISCQRRRGVKRVPGKQWTKTLAYMQADMANSAAVICFGVLREAVQNVNAT